ncbi:hypothetical protein AB0O42_02430 [Streptomyces sp. NPDC089922]|uniref:hypothetical protein n=1 Tax=Streptomyces sp. NPDC089922 TaxID=3155189 RepID=UPI00344A3A6E
MSVMPTRGRRRGRRTGGRGLAAGALLLALVASLTGQSATALAAPPAQTAPPASAAAAAPAAEPGPAPAAKAGPQAPAAPDPEAAAREAGIRALEAADVPGACPATVAPHTVVTCALDKGATASLALSPALRADLVLLRFVAAENGTTVRLVAPDGTTVDCRFSTVGQCPTTKAGTYTLVVRNDGERRGEVSLSYVPLLSTSACRTVGAGDRTLGAPTRFRATVAPLAVGECFTLDLASGDVLRMHTDGIFSTAVYNGAGTAVPCAPQTGTSHVDCTLTGPAPFRAAVTNLSGLSYDLSFARLSRPEGCTVVEPLAFGTSPGLDSTVPCRILRAPQSARYTFGPVTPTSLYPPMGQLLSSAGQWVSNDCAFGSCELAAGDYTWTKTNQILDATPFGMEFHSSRETRGCTPTHDNGMAAGPVSGTFAGEGQQLCLTLPTAAGQGVHLLNQYLRDGLLAVVRDATGAEQCRMNGPYGDRYALCRLTGTAPFRVVLDGTPASSYRLVVHRTGEHTGCAAWPRTGFDGTWGAQVTAAPQACLSLPADQHSTAEMIDFVDDGNKRLGTVQVVDATGAAACSGGVPLTCRLTPGVPYVAMVLPHQAAGLKVVRRDLSPTAACTPVPAGTVGGPSTPVELRSTLDARCLRISGAATDRFWLNDRMPGRYSSTDTSTWLTVVDAEGRVLCAQLRSVACRVTGSTSYAAVLSPFAYEDRPVRSDLDVWRVGTAAGWAPECTANRVPVDGFPLRNGVFSQTNTALCAVVDMKPDESFYVTGITDTTNREVPAVSLHSAPEWNSATPAYRCSQRWNEFSAECGVDPEGQAAQAVLILSPARVATPAVYSVRAVCGTCWAPGIETFTSIGPATSPAGTQTQAVLRGTSLRMETKVKLARSGSDRQPVLTPVSVSDDRTALTVRVDTAGLEPGAYDVVLDGVGHTDGVPSQGYLPKAYTVTAEDTTGKGRFVPIAPSRFLDTRDGTGAPKGRVGPGGVVTLQVGGVKGIPATGVTAVVMNVTAVQPTEAGHVMVYPNGQARPSVSNLNFTAGQIVPNLVTVAVVNGKVDLRNNAGSVDLIADVTGYYTDKGPGSALNPITPSRFLDTRDGTGAKQQRVGPGGVVTLQVAGVKGIPATGVTAVVMNVTAVQPTEAGHVSVYPNGQAAPGVSNLNFTAGQIVPNLVTVPVVNGKVDLRNNSGSVDLVADVTGYYAATGSTFSAAAPTRLLDTRTGLGGHPGSLGSGGTLHLKVAGVAGVPATGVTAVVLNVTVIAPTEDSHLVVWPHGVARPGASNLNYLRGQTVSNLVIVPVVDGQVSFYGAAGSLDLIADLNGYFVG